MKNLHKLKWMLFILLFGWVANANAQTYWSGVKDTQDITQDSHIILSGDVDLRGIIIINECNVTLDLNGYVIKRYNHGGYVIIVSTRGKLTIKDSRPNVPHYGKPSTFNAEYKTFNCLWEYNASYTASTSGAIRIDGGIITGGFGLIGGGVCCYGQLTMNGGTIAGNNVASDHYMVKNSSGNWVLHTRRPNTCDEMREAWNGMGSGGCYHYLDLSNPESQTSYNQCMGEGGGVYVGPKRPEHDSWDRFIMNGGRICYNYASLHGGGVYAGGKFIMRGSSTIDHNYVAGGYGAGVFVSHNIEFQPCVNGIPNGPWPDYMEENGDMVMENGTISYNNAYGGSGGGIMAWYASSVTIQNGNIHHNTALGQRAAGVGNGGGVYCENATLTVTNVQITDNECARYGGGLDVYNNSVLDMTGGTCYIARNIAKPRSGDPYASSGHLGCGGGVVITSNGSSAVFGTRVTIENNQAINGGGIYTINMGTGTCTLTGATVRNNTATTDGGGLYVANSAQITVQQNSKILNNTATSGRGGGLFISAASATSGKYTQTNSELSNNTAGLHGGGLFINTGTVSLTSSTLYNNKSTNGNGGGIFAGAGQITVDNSSITQNKAENGAGGGILSDVGSSGLITIKNNSVLSGNKAKNGGGLYTNSGRLSFLGGTIGGNTATVSGGGVYANYTVDLSGGYIGKNGSIAGGNTAVNGGGIYANSNVTMNGGWISGNAANNGGGVFVANGEFKLLNGTIGGVSSDGNYTNSGGYGGGLYVNGGTATLSRGSISGNKANGGYGGGIYMNGGTCTLSNGAILGGTSYNYANSAKFGGGIYSRGGTITVQGGHIDYNEATADGGGIYSNGPSATVLITKQGTTKSVLQYNKAENGGGIYANRGTVEFPDGNILYNYASNAGGGMYVNDEGTLLLKGNAVLNKNHVPTGHNGGGVYLKGTVKVGDPAKAQSSVTANSNFAHTLTGSETVETYVPDNQTRNNIYLPEPEAHPYTESQHRDVIWVYEGGIASTSSIGFSVPRNHVPVIYCNYSSTSRTYLDRFTTGDGHDLNTVLFDDSYRYKSVHYTTSPYFDPDHVYLYGFWPEAITSLSLVPDNGFTISENTITIKNEEGFAWLISYVNGLNGSEPHDCSNYVINLENDLDMWMYGWVPIGFKGKEEATPAPFRGTFNGNGHTIKGIYGMVYGQGIKGVRDYGLFGYVDGGTIQNVFLKGAEYYIDNNPNLVLGALVSELDGNGNVNNSEASGSLVAQSPDAILGGLIGRTGNNGTGTPTIHSTIAITDMNGGIMGGLIGHNVKGNMLNSFSNAKFTRLTNATTAHYCGGLVAVNRGRVENCYARLLGSAPANFGYLVGDNTGGTVKYSYATLANYTVTGKEGTLDGVETYGITELPYLYRHRDTQVEATNPHVPTDASADKQLMIVLNNWVEAPAQASGNYTKWGRPWQESDAQKPLNDDYPILRMPMANAVASRQGDPYLDYNDIDVLLEGYQASGDAIWMYNNSETVRGDNEGSSAKLYIAEDVALKNLNELKAYVGITLDNSAGGQGANPTYGEMLGVTTDATDWHMISSPLMDAPIGIDYSDNGSYDFSWGHPEGMPYYRFHQGERHGYFPSHRYGTAYPATDANLTDAANAGNYYNEWDFYAYSEPNYHWINFKRNSNSHRHFDTDTHEPIAYGNEPSLIPGKGYFAATREETFLQCQGNLNADEVDYGLTMTSGVPRHGYNLIGNPYQAYLDFDAFAESNSDDIDAIWDDKTTASYTILDEDAASYLTFAYDGSDNPDAAGRFIHPHQGFFVRTGLNGSMAYFQPDMRNTTTQNSTFRSNDHIDYPLVNLFVSEANGNSDMVTVELGRPTQGGALLMQGLRAGNGKIWCHYNDVDYAVAYTQPGVTEAAIRFETVADTEYTMRWNTHNGDFSYLHLIDNVTGADVDCLTTDEYRFSANTSDYKSRFRLVFGYMGIEEPEEVETSQNFAFVMGDELVVTGEGVLQVFDVTGRMVTSQELHGVQTTVSLPNAANGVYVLRLTEGKQSRVQKMVISK